MIMIYTEKSLIVFEAAMDAMVIKTIEDIDNLMCGDTEEIIKRDIICVMWQGYDKVMRMIEGAMDLLGDHDFDMLAGDYHPIENGD